MEFCQKWRIFRILPMPKKRIFWTWKAGNGTIFQIPKNQSLTTTANDCGIELMNIAVTSITILVAVFFILKYKCSGNHKLKNTLLPLHTSRSLLCFLVLLILILELCESLLTTISLSSILIILAVISSWILHRETELRNSFGTAVTGGGFAIISLARACRLFYLYRYNVSIEHVRVVTTASTAICCGFLAIIDSYILYYTIQRNKRYNIKPFENKYVSYKYSTSPFLSKITFHWIIDLLSRSYRTPLELQDLGDLPEKETTKVQYNQFRRIYVARKLKHPHGRVSLWRCYWEKIWVGFTAGGFLKLFGDIMTLIGPLAISKIIDYASVSQNLTIKDQRFIDKRALTFTEILENGYILGLLVFLASLLQSTLSQASTHILCVEGIRLKTSLLALIFEKALRLCSPNITEEEKFSNQEKDLPQRHQVADIGTLTNLMAEDAYNVMSFFWIGHYVWAIPLKIIAIVFLLYTKLGISAIVGTLCCILIVTPLQLILGKYMSENSKAITEKSDIRLRLINEVLQGMKVIKLRTWENVFEERVQKTREQELKLLDRDSIYWALINFITHASSILTTLLTFGIYFWMEGTKFDAGNIFTSLALFSQMTVPLFIFPVIVPIVINAVISTTRMEEFLQLPEVSNILPNSQDEILQGKDYSSTENFFCDSEPDTPQPIQSVTTFGSLDDIKEDDENLSNCSMKLKTILDSSADTVFEKDIDPPETSSSSVVSITSSVFSWGPDEKQLFIQKLAFPRGKLSIIVGKTGSGKTTLLLAILGEIYKLHGDIEWTKNVKVAYVAQKPWLLNATLRSNILFGSAYKPKRYRDVLQACALQSDIDSLPNGELTRIGEKGINLSGGQKQRVAMARAIYSDADVIIMDDPLSGIDQQVSRQIFEMAINKLLLKNGRTVIMVTHRLELLPAAHQIIIMEDCRIRNVGTKSNIEELDPTLATEWRSAAIYEDNHDHIQKTARDRWYLIKLISRIGLNVKNRHASDGSWITDQDTHVYPASFVPLRTIKSALSGSRYLAHDLTEIPVAAEEWNFGKKRCKSHYHHHHHHHYHLHMNAIRCSSLQTEDCSPPPVLRQHSTPTILESTYIVSRKRHNTLDNGQQSNILKQLFLNRSNSLHEKYPSKRLLSVESTTIDVQENGTNYNDRTELQESDQEGNDMVNKVVWMIYTKAGGLLPSLTYVAAALTCQGLRVYTDLLLSRWTNQSGEYASRECEHTMFCFKEYIYLSFASILLSLVYNAAGQWAGSKARRKLHERAMCGLLKAPMSFFESNPIGKVLNRFSADIGVIDKKISTSIQRLTSFILLCGSAMIVNLIISPWFLIAAIPTCSIYYFLQRFYRRSARELQRLDGSTRGPVAAHFSEILAGLPTLRAFKKENHFMDVAMRHLDANTNAFLILNTSSRWLGIALDYLGASIVFAAIFTALLSAEFYPHRVTPALVGLAINYTLLVPIYLNWVVKFTAEIEMYMGSVARISAYEQLPREDYRKKVPEIPEHWPTEGEILFDGVSLRYESRKNPVVWNLSLRIPPRQKLGICGRTGSGKSSTAMSLFQLIKICQGRILIDGIDIRHVPLQILRSRISVIPQDVIMFSGTIRENLDPLGEHKDEELWNALELAQMKDTIMSFTQGLNHEVREGGENLSVGELQLLSMARAVLRRSSIIVLDEATSALDTTTEKSLLEAASLVFKDKTVITIAHRAAALIDSDKVIVFDEGRIVEEGAPQELMYRPDGFFAALLKIVEEKG